MLYCPALFNGSEATIAPPSSPFHHRMSPSLSTLLCYTRLRYAQQSRNGALSKPKRQGFLSIQQHVMGMKPARRNPIT